jgi:hypothetical protein
MFLDPGLQLEELDLEQSLRPLVVSPTHPMVVRVTLAPRLHRVTVRVQQRGLAVIVDEDVDVEIVKAVEEIVGVDQAAWELFDCSFLFHRVPPPERWAPQHSGERRYCEREAGYQRPKSW